MRRHVTTLAGLLGVALLGAGTWQNSDERAIRKHIETNYFEGVRTRDTALAHRTFHPQLPAMYSVREGKLAPLPIPEWVVRVGSRLGVPDSVQRRVVSVDITGTAAVAKIELAAPQAVVVDYLSLLRVNGEWTVIGKIFDVRPVTAAAR